MDLEIIAWTAQISPSQTNIRFDSISFHSSLVYRIVHLKKKHINANGEIKCICHKLEHNKGTTNAAFISNP